MQTSRLSIAIQVKTIIQLWWNKVTKKQTKMKWDLDWY